MEGNCDDGGKCNKKSKGIRVLISLNQPCLCNIPQSWNAVQPGSGCFVEGPSIVVPGLLPVLWPWKAQWTWHLWHPRIPASWTATLEPENSRS